MITDGIVSQKDHEISELKMFLAKQNGNLSGVAIGAEAVAAVLDQDILIRDEREKLAKLQELWKHKLRQAEIDISVERAKITRDRAEIEEKLAVYEKERSQQGSGSTQADQPAEASKKPARGRWLARLGLKDSDD
jgi:hypothetical protein